MKVDPNDPWLLLGGYHTQTALLRATADLGPTGRGVLIDNILHSDDAFRAAARAMSPGSHNAPEMLRLEQTLIDALRSNAFPDLHTLWATVIDQGGYAPTPPNARPEDQLYMVEAAFVAACSAMDERSCQALANGITIDEQTWLSDRQTNATTISFGQWLKDHGFKVGAENRAVVGSVGESVEFLCGTRCGW